MTLSLILAMALGLAGSILMQANAQDGSESTASFASASSDSADSDDSAVGFFSEVVTSSTPYIVGIRSTALGINYCAGALIAPQFILTSNDCAPKNGANESVVIGSLSAQGNANRAVQVAMSDVAVHPNYNTKTKEFDFLLIKLKSASELTSVALVPTSRFTYGSTGDMLGWNTTTASSNALHRASVWFLSAKDCGSLYDSQLCAVGLKMTDACYADPGSPLIVTSAGRDVLVGIASKQQGCGKAITPTLFSRVSVARTWIQKIAGV